MLFSRGPFHYQEFTLILAWISNYIHYKGLGENTYPYPNIHSATVDVLELISIFILHFTAYVIMYAYWD